MSYNYSALRGKIIEKYGTVRQFASAMGWSEATGYNKLNNNISWKQSEISHASEMLNIMPDEIAPYFFTLEVQKN